MSAEVEVDVLDRKSLKRHIDRVPDEACGVRNLTVDVARGDDERL